MKHICVLACLLAAAVAVGGEKPPSTPFPGADETGIDPVIAELVRYRIAKHNDSEGDTADKKVVAMGTNAVPTLIAMAKMAANKDPRVVHPEKYDDFGFELRRPLHMLVDIGDRRAIPVLTALVPYDHPKPRRMLQNLAELLCHGSDEQLQEDAKSNDPHVARAASMVQNDLQTFAYSKEKYRRKTESNKAPEATR